MEIIWHSLFHIGDTLCANITAKRLHTKKVSYNVYKVKSLIGQSPLLSQLLLTVGVTTNICGWDQVLIYQFQLQTTKHIKF